MKPLTYFLIVIPCLGVFLYQSITKENICKFQCRPLKAEILDGMCLCKTKRGYVVPEFKEDDEATEKLVKPWKEHKSVKP